MQLPSPIHLRWNKHFRRNLICAASCRVVEQRSNPNAIEGSISADNGSFEVAVSGDHHKIESWRQAERLRLTQTLSPDLLKPKSNEK